MARRFAIMTEDPGWHGDVLRAAFAHRGCDAAFVSLADCRMDLGSPTAGLVVPGFEKNLPDGVFVRGIAAGTLEQITFRLGILHALREAGVPVFNDGRAIERSVDKSMTSFLLHRAGVPTPATWVTESERDARFVVMRETSANRELVIKPLFGSQGIGLKRLAGVADLPPAGEYNQVFYLQRFIDMGEGRWHDWRIFVAGHRVVAAMIRRGVSWINNVAQGARCESVQADAELAHLSETASRALALDYAGVDIIRGPDGSAQVVEVNSCPAWKGLQEVCDVDIAQALVDDLLVRRFPLHAVESVAG
jgi:tetrahydromethanopterin:alpha-L-glutamate ligase